MTDPYVVPDWQRWQASVTELRPVPDTAETAVSWRSEAAVALLIAAYSTILGGIVGLLWSRLAPKLSLPRAHPRIVDAINGSEAATKILLGDDMWLALFGILAGVVAVAGLLIVARDAGGGPGGAIGLAVGGVLGSIVAAQLGHHLQQPHLIAALHAQYPGITHHSVVTVLNLFTFKVRARAVLVAWPITAVLVHAATVGLRGWRTASNGPTATR